MICTIAYLGPPGTYTELAALTFRNWLGQQQEAPPSLIPYATNARVIQAVAQGEAIWGVVPVENSIEGSVPMTLDTLWQVGALQIHKGLVLPISHAFLGYSQNWSQITTVCAHPQALAQCQHWLASHVPQADLTPTNSNTEVLHSLAQNPHVAAIASLRAADLYRLPILAHPINDYPDNCTRFWVVHQDASPAGRYTSLGFSVYANIPGALVKCLQAFADEQINMSRIESRPSKRSLGDYLFFVDLEASLQDITVQRAIARIETMTEQLRILGSYDIL